MMKESLSSVLESKTLVTGAVIGALAAVAFNHSPDATEATPPPHESHHVQVKPRWQDLDFDTDPEIIQLDPALPNPKGNEKITPQGVTLHWWSFDAGGNIHRLEEELRKNKACGDTGCSVQYAVTDDGKIYRMMDSATELAYHAPGANHTTFGIEIEGEPKDFALSGDNYNPAKFKAIVELAHKLNFDFHLPVNGPATCGDAKGTHGHYEFNKCGNPPYEKPDPGVKYTKAVKAAVRSMDK